MSENGRSEPVVQLIVLASQPASGPVDDDAYDAMLEMDRLEELLEAMNDLGAPSRMAVEALPVSPTTVEVIAELEALRFTTAEQIEARLAELAGLVDDE